MTRITPLENTERNKKKNCKKMSTLFLTIVILCNFFQKSNPAFNVYCLLNCVIEDKTYRNTVCLREPCGLGPKCGKYAKSLDLDAIDRRMILKTHNKIRQKVALGLNKHIKEESSNMYLMSYSLELQFSAQCWANACESNSDKCRVTPNFKTVQQNVFVSDNVFGDETAILEAALNSWVKEFKYITPDIIENFPSQEVSKKFKRGSQILWAESKFVGCGRSVHNGKALVICNYAPAGNIPGKAMWIKGKPCSNCLKNDTCGRVLKGLCGNFIHEIFDIPFFMGKQVGIHRKKNFLIYCIILKYLFQLL